MLEFDAAPTLVANLKKGEFHGFTYVQPKTVHQTVDYSSSTTTTTTGSTTFSITKPGGLESGPDGVLAQRGEKKKDKLQHEKRSKKDSGGRKGDNDKKAKKKKKDKDKKKKTRKEKT